MRSIDFTALIAWGESRRTRSCRLKIFRDCPYHHSISWARQHRHPTSFKSGLSERETSVFKKKKFELCSHSRWSHIVGWEITQDKGVADNDVDEEADSAENHQQYAHGQHSRIAYHRKMYLHAVISVISWEERENVTYRCRRKHQPHEPPIRAKEGQPEQPGQPANVPNQGAWKRIGRIGYCHLHIWNENNSHHHPLPPLVLNWRTEALVNKKMMPPQKPTPILSV